MKRKDWKVRENDAFRAALDLPAPDAPKPSLLARLLGDPGSDIRCRWHPLHMVPCRMCGGDRDAWDVTPMPEPPRISVPPAAQFTSGMPPQSYEQHTRTQRCMNDHACRCEFVDAGPDRMQMSGECCVHGEVECGPPDERASKPVHWDLIREAFAQGFVFGSAEYLADNFTGGEDSWDQATQAAFALWESDPENMSRAMREALNLDAPPTDSPVPETATEEEG